MAHGATGYRPIPRPTHTARRTRSTSLMYVIPMAKYRPDVITPEAIAVPQRVWLVMGTLDSIAGVMQSFSVAYVGNSAPALVVLLLQSAIPSSMVITRIFLKTKYKPYQYAGATAVIAGILVVLIPKLLGGTAGGTQTGIWSAVLVLSCVPMCLSSVYKEKALGDVEIDPIYLNYWVAVYQFLISFPLLVPMGFASQPPIAVQDLPTNLWYGMRCFAGINSQPSDNCHLGPIFSTLYIVFNLGYNVLIIMLLKYGSSNILWLCLTLQVPVANLVFAIPGMPNGGPVSWADGLGLVIIMAGLVTYRFYTPVRALILKRMGYPDSVIDGKVASKAALAAVAAGDGTAESLLSVNDDTDPTAVSPGSSIGGSTPVRGAYAAAPAPAFVGLLQRARDRPRPRSQACSRTCPRTTAKPAPLRGQRLSLPRAARPAGGSELTGTQAIERCLQARARGARGHWQGAAVVFVLQLLLCKEGGSRQPRSPPSTRNRGSSSRACSECATRCSDAQGARSLAGGPSAPPATPGTGMLPAAAAAAGRVSTCTQPCSPM